MTDEIPFLDLEPAYAELKESLDEAYARVMASNRFLMGPELGRFEQNFADYCEASHCIGVSNGLDALRLILQALDVGPGDEVIVPSHTFIATWLAVSSLGATPVPIEPNAATCNMDPGGIEPAISGRTKAILPVHLYGQTADMQAIMDVAGRHGLAVIEDAAQAHGARYRDRRAGSLAHAAAFSFYPAKNLGAFGDGGAVTTTDAQLAEKIRSLGNYGSSTKYQHDLKGANCRLDELQAAFLDAKLPQLDNWNRKRAQIAGHYLQGLSGLEGLILPQVHELAEPVWHLFTVRHAKRDALQSHLAASGVRSLIHYPVPPHLSGAFGQDRDWPALPLAEKIARTTLSLPLWPHMSEAQTGRVIDAVRAFPS